MTKIVPGEYPKQFEKTIKIKDGTKVFLRPIKPEDRELWLEFYLSLSKMAKYYRFFSSRPDPDEKMIKQYTQIDYVNNFALIALVKENEKERMVGVVRYVLDPKSGNAELAIVIADDWQGRGLGTKMLIEMLGIMIKRKVHKVVGDVFLENDKMMQLMRESGFKFIGESQYGIRHFEFAL
ncbi:MAG: GNAT family N-acetyltransferase [Candidatus Helarchaeota archaeon]